ncbi:hypothetical protein [Jeotgalibaca sp. A127]|uniref:hypothetical protein n=1 Tax=Jeotgalibaca sp. A127 TaxID=3457324 RepID=UPI003FD07562
MSLFKKKNDEESKDKAPSKGEQRMIDKIEQSGRYFTEMFVVGDLFKERFAINEVYQQIATFANQHNLKILKISSYKDKAVQVMFEKE